MRTHLNILYLVLFGMVWIASGCPEPIAYQTDTVSPPDSKHMVHIKDASHPQSGFWIDAFEYPNVPNQRPLVNTTFADAKQACQDAGKRLCTASEWRRACLGSEKLRFGYADTYEAQRCHTASTLASGHTSMMQANEWTVESGSKQYCQTDGVFDLIGNVEEWVLDDWQGREGSLEGGAWYTYTEYADCSGNYSRQPDYRTPMNRPIYSAGFRCCWTPSTPTSEDISTDARERQSSPQTTTTYNGSLERPIGHGLWMDIYEYPNQPFVKPQTNVTWDEANDACQAAGKRLCSVTEWELGCSGNENWNFPYGQEYISDLCDIGHTAPSATGTFLGCQSSFGVQDMVGSVWEWTATEIDATVLKTNPNDQLKEIRGGSWFVEEQKGVCRPSDGYPVVSSDHRYPDIGFRCCRGEPMTNDLKAPSTIQCPSDMVAIDNYCLDRFEYPNLASVNPIADATFTMAKQACKDQGKHLCTDREWLRACEGQQKRRWPYGNVYRAQTCNDHGWVAVDNMGSNQPSGKFHDCATPEGASDMSGNLWEWTDGEIPTLRGGGWQLSAGLGQCRSFSNPSADYHAGEVGFRCCANLSEAQRLQSP